MLVEKVMDLHPAQCFLGQDLVSAARTIHEHNAAGALVFDPGFRLAGTLVLDDFVRWEARRSDSRGWRRTLDEPSLVAHAMTHDVLSVSSRESISDAARVMLYARRSVLPVLDDDGWPVGLISARDIAAAAARTDRSIQDEVCAATVTGAKSIGSGSIDLNVEAGTVTITGVIESRKKLIQLEKKVASITGVSCIDVQNIVLVDAVRSTA